ncbi:MAG: hypothetical protein V7776_08940 [Halopseudomonas aestusnigri]
MHDWTLVSITFDWKQGTLVIQFKNAITSTELRAIGVIDLHVPRHREWGPSVSVNEANISKKDESGHATVTIEMQTGDELKITASEFVLPKGF